MALSVAAREAASSASTRDLLKDDYAIMSASRRDLRSLDAAISAYTELVLRKRGS